MNELKEKSKILSDLLVSDHKDMSRIEDLFNKFEMQFSSVKEENLTKSVDFNKEKDILGIWKMKNVKGETILQRNEDKRNEWHAWANVHEIPLKTHKKRVVLLGESVARGFFYTPNYSVADELESILTSSNVFRDVEVVDLSKNAIEMEEIINVAQSCDLLNPDLMVMFAGNNWLSELYQKLDSKDYKELSLLYKKEGFESVKLYLENKFEKIISNFIDLVITNNKNNKTTTVFVIPAFNLFNWKSDDTEKTVSLLKNDDLIKWFEAKGKAENALIQNDYDRLEFESNQMIELDSSNPLGYELLSKAYMQKDKIPEAIQCLDRSKDTILFGRALNSSPRCFQVIRDTIIKKASQEGVQVVDLFSIFNKIYEDRYKHNELFLDYCHLSTDGIKIAMKYTAQVVIESVANEKISIKSIPDSKIFPKKNTESVAHFAAAIHNAHWSQPKEILEYHCQKAIELDENIKTLMLLYADLSSRKNTNELCRSFEEIILEGSMHQFEGGLAFLHPRGEKMMDLDLIDTIANAIKPLGLDYETELKELRFSQHGITKIPTSLLEPFYHAQGYNKTNDTISRNFFRIRSTEKVFNIISDGLENLQVKMCYRSLHEIRGNLKIYLNTNEQEICEAEINRDWNSICFEIAKDKVCSGINKLILKWPVPNVFKETHNKNNYVSVNSFFPVLGDIYSLTIATV
ncbi:M48 family metallopeptidase [Aquimarina sp. AU474]|uniref:tetratricopeptide repeat protein n=1 Tax=Aquimarina sp. AU474 TaxID=2108529 RepID=UPI000D68E957|nr:hypothetical protein [Aquimarina sp. AU474]